MLQKKYLLILSFLITHINLKPVLENWVCPDLRLIQSAEFTVQMANTLSDEAPGGTPSAYARLTSCKARSIFLLKAACMALRQFQEICTAPELQTLKNNIALTSATLISEVLPLSQNTTPVIDPELGEMSFSSSFAQSIPRRDIVFTAFPPAATVSQHLVLKSLFLMLSDLFDLLELINAQPAADLYISKETFNPREFGIAEIILTKTKDSIESVNAELLSKIYDYFAAVALILEPSVVPLEAEEQRPRAAVQTVHPLATLPAQAQPAEHRRTIQVKRTLPKTTSVQQVTAASALAPTEESGPAQVLSRPEASGSRSRFVEFQKQLREIACTIYRDTIGKTDAYYQRLRAEAFQLRDGLFNGQITDEQVRTYVGNPKLSKKSIGTHLSTQRHAQARAMDLPASATSEQQPSELASAKAAAPTSIAIHLAFRRELHNIACQIHKQTLRNEDAYFQQLLEAAENLRREKFEGQITDEEIASLISSNAFSKKSIANYLSVKCRRACQAQATAVPEREQQTVSQSLTPPAPMSSCFVRECGFPPVSEESRLPQHCQGVVPPLGEIPRLGQSLEAQAPQAFQSTPPNLDETSVGLPETEEDPLSSGLKLMAAQARPGSAFADTYAHKAPEMPDPDFTQQRGCELLLGFSFSENFGYDRRRKCPVEEDDELPLGEFPHGF